MLLTSKCFIIWIIVLSQINYTNSFKISRNIKLQENGIIPVFLDQLFYQGPESDGIISNKTRIINILDSNIHHFTLFTEKRHKEAMFGRKFDKKPTSSQVRHYRIVGRGGGIPRLSKKTGLPTRPIRLPYRRCALLGKMDNTKAIKRSHSGVRTKRTQKLNLHYKKIWHPEKNYFIRLRLSMRGLKTIKRLGIVEAARRFNLDIDNRKLFAGYAILKKKKIEEKVMETVET